MLRRRRDHPRSRPPPSTAGRSARPPRAGAAPPAADRHPDRSTAPAPARSQRQVPAPVRVRRPVPEGPVTASGHRAAAWRCGRAVRRAAPPSARASAEKPAAVLTARPPSPPSPSRVAAPGASNGDWSTGPYGSTNGFLAAPRRSAVRAIIGRGFGTARSCGHRHRHADNGDSDQCRYRSLLHLIHLTPPRRRRCPVRLSKRKRLPLRPIALSVTAELDPSGSRIRPFNGQCVIVCPRRDATTVRCARRRRDYRCGARRRISQRRVTRLERVPIGLNRKRALDSFTWSRFLRETGTHP